jgi:DNA-binding transcriptional ArsR family regulator
VSGPAAAAARKPDEPDGSGVDAAFRALAVPHRRRILRLVRDGEMSSGQIARHFDVTPQAVSQHLRTLRDAGLLAERREGVRRFYVVRPEALAPVREAVEELWPARLAMLKRIVEADLRKERE